MLIIEKCERLLLFGVGNARVVSWSCVLEHDSTCMVTYWWLNVLSFAFVDVLFGFCLYQSADRLC